MSWITVSCQKYEHSLALNATLFIAMQIRVRVFYIKISKNIKILICMKYS